MKKRLCVLTFSASLLIFLGATTNLSATESSVLSELPKKMTWTNIVVEFNDTTLEDLASTYYGDVKEASMIYEANRAVIPKSKKLHKGMKLKLPITEKFRDQPERLGWQ